ncbi:MAG TPA: hypothetical protein VGL00_20550 [Terracidiphilus sp.]|jgi:hypothetical protein
MGSFDREQLEALKRQIEEDYRLDIAAIERLQRRFVPSGPVAAVRETPPAPVTDRNVTILPSLESQAEAQPDELTNTLRGMFSSHRR